jgi:Tol biopolymer transport system component
MRSGLLWLLIAVLLTSQHGIAAVVTRISVSSASIEGAGRSLLPSLSADGRYVAFVSRAPNLTADDGDTVADVFVRDRTTGVTTLVSRSSAGVKGDNDSGAESSYAQGGPVISADGRFVAFTSNASNLVPGDTNVSSDVFVHDRDADEDGIFDEAGAVATRRVSVSSDQTQANSNSQFPAISADGRVIAFASTATNLVAGDTNATRDVFVHDRDSDGDGIYDEAAAVVTARMSVASGGTQGNGESGRPDLQISADGNVVAFLSEATNLVPGDDNDVADVFVHDRATGQTQRVNVSSGGAASEYYPTYDFALSGNGRYVAFSTQDQSLVTPPAGYGGVGDNGGSDVLVHDRLTGVTSTWADGAPAGDRIRTASYRPVLSDDGGIIAFLTRFGVARFDGEPENNRVELYVHNRLTGTTSTLPLLVSDGAPTTVLARGVALSGDGRTVGFDTEGAILPEDQNGTRDVFVESCAAAAIDDPRFVSCEPMPFAGLAAGEGARFEAGTREFRKSDTPADGLGPVFNAASCATCHNRPWIGGTSNELVTRIGAAGPGGFDPLVGQGGPVIQTQGIDTPTCSVAGETVPAGATIVAPRDPPALFGLGLIEAIADESILRRADPDDRDGDGISGRPNLIAGRVGRFGRKAQTVGLREFAGDAYLTEMGITSPDFPFEVAPQGNPPACDPVPDPEDDGSNVAAFVDFLTLLAPIPAGRYPSADARREATAGGRVFRQLRCGTCHEPRLRLPRDFGVARGIRRAALFTDLLLHDMGATLADGIPQGDASGSEFRTAPLAGVGWTAPYLHDGRAATLDAAILAHDGEARASRDAFSALPEDEKTRLRAFLRSL